MFSVTRTTAHIDPTKMIETLEPALAIFLGSEKVAIFSANLFDAYKQVSTPFAGQVFIPYKNGVALNFMISEKTRFEYDKDELSLIEGNSVLVNI